MTEPWALQASPQDQRYNSDHIPTHTSENYKLQSFTTLVITPITSYSSGNTHVFIKVVVAHQQVKAPPRVVIRVGVESQWAYTPSSTPSLSVETRPSNPSTSLLLQVKKSAHRQMCAGHG
jgi:hypothetical protein